VPVVAPGLTRRKQFDFSDVLTSALGRAPRGARSASTTRTMARRKRCTSAERLAGIAGQLARA